MVLSTIFVKINSFRPKTVLNNICKLYAVSIKRDISTTFPKMISMSEYDRLTDRILIENQKDESDDGGDDIRNKLKLVLDKQAGVCLFSTISNSIKLPNNNPNYPVSFISNYYLDFDGKPFFRIPTNDTISLFQYRLINESPPSSVNIYTNDTNNIINLIIFGKTVETESKDEINRFNWIVNNIENDYNSINSGYRYFKMIIIDQLELITASQIQDKQLEYSLFNFNNNHNNKFKISSKNMLDYVSSNYEIAIKKKLENEMEISIVKIEVTEIDYCGMTIDIYNKDESEKIIVNKDKRINFTKTVNSHKDLYDELNLINNFSYF